MLLMFLLTLDAAIAEHDATVGGDERQLMPGELLFSYEAAA
jgi:hypothetical protein